MKHRNHWIAAVLAAALFTSLFTGCGASSGTGGSAAAVMESNQAQADAAQEVQTVTEASGAGNGQTGLDADALTPQDSRKIIYNATLWLETKDYDQASADLLAAAQQAEGYIQTSEESGSAEKGNRSVFYTLRIPSDRYSEFLSAASQAANLTRRSESTQDVTADYVDLEARLASLEQQRQRLDELAAQAQSLEDLLAIEDQRTQVQYQIESYTGQMNVLKDQIAYSTVEIYLDEVTELTPQSPSFVSRVAAAFRGSWSGFVDVVQELVIGLIYLLPFLVCVAVVAVVVILLARRAAKRHPRAPKPSGNPGEPADGAQPPKYTPMK